MQRFEKEAGIKISILVMLAFLFALPFALAEDQLIVKFHSEGDGRSVNVNLAKYFPGVQTFFHSVVTNITIKIENGIAIITPIQPDWVGDEPIIFSPYRDKINWTGKTEENITIANAEPIIEMSFPDIREFGVEPGQIEFSVSVFDPDGDMINTVWSVDGVSIQREEAKGRTISRFVFSSGENNAKGMIFRDYNIAQNESSSLISAMINDGHNTKTREWRFTIVNKSCIDEWECGNWSGCIESSHYRNCIKTNPQCIFNYNKPPTEWNDPNCVWKKTCSANWTCGEWNKCTIDYNSDIIKQGLITDYISKKQERICQDSTSCLGGVGVEKRDCSEKIPVITREVNWCFEKYIEIYNADNGMMISRIRKSTLDNPKLDIELSLGDLARIKTCWYCADGIMDYDEEDADCGGSCESCAVHNLALEYNLGDYRTFIFLFVDGILLLLLFRVAFAHQKS